MSSSPIQASATVVEEAIAGRVSLMSDEFNQQSVRVSCAELSTVSAMSICFYINQIMHAFCEIRCGTSGDVSGDLECAAAARNAQYVISCCQHCIGTLHGEHVRCIGSTLHM